MGTEAAADLASTREADTKSAPTRGADTKRRIVDAAEEVVLRDGVARLTLDAAAAEAGLSKGGILYHKTWAMPPGRASSPGPTSGPP
jgi:hypothetical protein